MFELYFPSKKDAWFIAMFWGFILFIVFIYVFGTDPVGLQFIAYKSIWGYILSGSIIALLLWIWFKTGYLLESGVLKIQSGPFKRKINIDDIYRVNKLKSLFTAPALSVDRIVILYGNNHEIIISPKNEKEFLELLLKVNPNIELMNR
ncbi:PH domain-containing protein [Halobacillus yeomjeoni]|uniref:PH domain-containing protein n=1 Tax=Halobacillus yeomjeoni TaxID=311194 RepID=UPI001CD22E08|nr:PH domain-containing protein [Halobacillus yeomjeoni]MCA0983460.1 PH domain-containing protein [Halobacillus yeomjeoni]